VWEVGRQAEGVGTRGAGSAREEVGGGGGKVRIR
jgi:hypothetical protein